MGTWGTGLYGSDDAQDLRDQLKDVLRAPWTPDQLVEWARSQELDPIETELVLADQLWKYGIDHPPQRDRALAIVEREEDLAAKRALGMGAKELEKRRRALALLADRWRKKNPKPTPRKIVNGPEPFLLETGACAVFPSSRGEPKNPYLGPSLDAMHPFVPDSWGGFIVLDRAHRYDVFAHYLVAPIEWRSEQKPVLADFLVGRLQLESWFRVDGEELRPRATWGTVTRQHLGRMQVEPVGMLPIDPAKVRAAFPKAPLGTSISNHLRLARSLPEKGPAIAALLT